MIQNGREIYHFSSILNYGTILNGGDIMQGKELCLSFGLEVIYDHANFHFEASDKVGIVGVNGAGKTTLLKVILGMQPLDSGSIITQKKRLGYLPQEILLENKEITVLEYLMGARPIKELEEEINFLYQKIMLEKEEKLQKKMLKRVGQLQELMEYYDCYHAEDILFQLLEDMKIDIDLLDMKLMDLSGGQKSKIAFAHLLYSKPEILLLDEPTNHLDVETRKFVIEYLKNYQGMVLMISHDIEFLDQIITKTLFIDKVSKKMHVYEGNYSLYLKKAKALKEAKEKLIEKQEKEIEKLKDIVLLYSNSSGKRKKMAQSREKTLEKLEKNRLEKDRTRKQVKLNIKPNKEGSKIPIKVNHISFHYPDSPNLISNLSFLVESKERFLIVGENGVGKSTLLKLLFGLLTPVEGNIWFGNKTDMAYYAQEQELLDLEKTILENVDQKGYSEKELRTILGSFLFYGDDVFKKVAVLSPGEKARISLCKIMLEKANLLLLDEPTNHLDPETQKIIGENFREFDGTIIVVSHNPSFVEQIGIDRMLILPSGKITNYSSEKLEYYYKLNQK